MDANANAGRDADQAVQSLPGEQGELGELGELGESGAPELACDAVVPTFTIIVTNTTNQDISVLYEIPLEGDQGVWITKADAKPPVEPPYVGEVIKNAVTWIREGENRNSGLAGEIALRVPLGGIITLDWTWVKDTEPKGTCTVKGTTAVTAQWGVTGKGTLCVTFTVVIL
jgi:hypothetical protein